LGRHTGTEATITRELEAVSAFLAVLCEEAMEEAEKPTMARATTNTRTREFFMG